MSNPNPLPTDRPHRDDRQTQTHYERARDFLSDQNPIGLFLVGLALFGLLIQGMPYILSGIYTFFVSFSLVLWTTLDFAFGARAVSEFPPLMWMVWGAVLGASMAFWLNAPLYGWKNKRALIILVPLLLMVVAGSFINLKVPLPPQPELLGTATPAPTAVTALPGSVTPASPDPMLPGAMH